MRLEARRRFLGPRPGNARLAPGPDTVRPQQRGRGNTEEFTVLLPRQGVSRSEGRYLSIPHGSVPRSRGGRSEHDPGSMSHRCGSSRTLDPPVRLEKGGNRFPFSKPVRSSVSLIGKKERWHSTLEPFCQLFFPPPGRLPGSDWLHAFSAIPAIPDAGGNPVSHPFGNLLGTLDRETRRDLLSPSRAFSCYLGVPSRRANHRATWASLGMRQSPRGERLTDPTLGPSGRQERLYWLAKKRRRNTINQRLTSSGV